MDADVIIVGAGVAGSYLGHLLSKTGLEVLIMEKNKKIKRDSGIVSTKIKDFIKIDYTKIKKMRFVSPSGYTFFIRSKRPFAYILQRESFGKTLRKVARKSGARIVYERCRGIEMSHDYVKVRGEKTYKASIIVGADGANSFVRQSFGIQPPKIYFGLACTGKQSKIKDITIYFDKRYSPDFFAWLIPINNEAGIISRDKPYEHLKTFLDNICFVPSIFYGSPIPIGTTRSFSKRCLLLGDACGQVKPLTGGGIIYSLTCARHAACVIENSFKKDFDELSKYERLWKEDIGREIRLQLLARKIYARLSNSQIDDFFKLFGKKIENIDNFEYDNLSSILCQLPKPKLALAFSYFLSDLLSFQQPHNL